MTNDLLKITSGMANVPSVQWNAHQSLILTNQLIDYMRTTWTIPPKNMVKQAAATTTHFRRKNLLHDGSKWYTPDYSKAFYVDIEATSITATTDFEINGCKMLPTATGKWRLICDASATKEVNKANVLKTLFEDNQAGGARAKTTYITGITAIRTPDTYLQGKKMYYFYFNATSLPASYSLALSDTTTNTNCQAWTYIAVGKANMDISLGGVSINSKQSSGSAQYSDETVTDTSADRQNNPASIAISAVANGTSPQSATSFGFFAGKGTLTPTGPSNATASYIDFLVTHGVPAFSTNTDDELTVLFESASLATIAGVATGLAYAYMTSDGSVPTPTAKISFNGGTNYTSDAFTAIQYLGSGGTDLRLKVEWTRGANTVKDYLWDMGVVYG